MEKAKNAEIMIKPIIKHSNSDKKILRTCGAGSPDRPDMSKIIALIKYENQKSEKDFLRE